MRSLPLKDFDGMLPELPLKYQAISALGVITGCRISEILSLRRFDLVTRDGRLKERVRFEKLKSRGGPHRRELGIPEKYRPLIAAHLRAEESRGWDRPDDYVFRGQCGRHLSRVSCYHFFRRVLGPGYGTHWMRKTFAQAIFRWYLGETPGDPMRALDLTRRALGHARIDTTVKYLGIEDSRLEEAQNAVFG